MLYILSCITVEHDIGLVLLAGALCAFGMWVTARLYQYARSRPAEGATTWFLLTGATAGISIWCTHFVAMLGYRPEVPVDFDLALTVVSLFIAILGSALGVMIAARLKMRAAPLVGGAVLGLAISGMHYAGMIAYRVQGVVHWDMTYLIASILVALAFSATALWLGNGAKRWSELQMAALLTLGTVGLHFTGMTAFSVSPLLISGDFVNPEALRTLAFGIAGTAVLIVVGGFFSYAVENRVRMETIAELTAARNAAESASRAKTEFMSVLSHELRTPLTVIMGYAAILASQNAKDADGKRAAKVPLTPEMIADQAGLYGEKIKTSATHLLTLINEILDYTGMEMDSLKLDKSAFVLPDLLREIRGQFDAMASEKGISIKIDCDAITAHADRKRVTQILFNLMSNAIKFSGGDSVLLRARRTEDGLQIEVEDNGCGIAEADFSKIFEAFQQAADADNRAVGGTGLGLAICKKLALAHKGDITVQSALGQGSTFTLLLPRMADVTGLVEPMAGQPDPMKLAS